MAVNNPPIVSQSVDSKCVNLGPLDAEQMNALRYVYDPIIAEKQAQADAIVAANAANPNGPQQPVPVVPTARQYWEALHLAVLQGEIDKGRAMRADAVKAGAETQPKVRAVKAAMNAGKLSSAQIDAIYAAAGSPSLG